MKGKGKGQGQGIRKSLSWNSCCTSVYEQFNFIDNTWQDEAIQSTTNILMILSSFFQVPKVGKGVEWFLVEAGIVCICHP